MSAGRITAGIAGVGLIVLALLPTPDDVTVVSPTIQFTAGLSLLTLAITGEKK